MVVEGSAGDAGGANDLLGGDVGVAALAEEAARGGDQGCAGRLGTFGLTASCWIYIHAVCMLGDKANFFRLL